MLDQSMKILFVCKGNVGRSQMAEAFFEIIQKRMKLEVQVILQISGKVKILMTLNMLRFV